MFYRNPWCCSFYIFSLIYVEKIDYVWWKLRIWGAVVFFRYDENYWRHLGIKNTPVPEGTDVISVVPPYWLSIDVLLKIHVSCSDLRRALPLTISAILCRDASPWKPLTHITVFTGSCLLAQKWSAHSPPITLAALGVTLCGLVRTCRLCHRNPIFVSINYSKLGADVNGIWCTCQ